MPTPECTFPNLGNEAPTSWGLSRDKQGYRDYVVAHLVEVEKGQGPYSALTCPGLPTPGSSWAILDDFDDYAYCTLEAGVSPLPSREGKPTQFFQVKQVFTTRPAVYCPDDSGGFDDPLLRADVVSGEFKRYTEEAVYDRYGQPIVSSSWEQFRGPQAEFDRSRPAVTVTQNVADLELPLLAALIDSVNLYPMWGLGERQVKFSGVTWKKHYHTDCTVYYTRTLEFDINSATFDRDLLDEGTKVLPGHWDLVTGLYVADLVGAVAYTCTTVSGSTDITIQGSGGADIVDGLDVLGTGIPADSVVDSVALPTVTLTQQATANGTVVVKFGRIADPENPSHFKRFQDKKGENTRVILDGGGYPATDLRSGAIENIDNEAPMIVTTSVAHGLSTGDIVLIFGVQGLTDANAVWTITVIDTTTFTLDGSFSSQVYEGGGQWRVAPSEGGPGNIHIEKYPSRDLTLLALPGAL